MAMSSSMSLLTSPAELGRRGPALKARRSSPAACCAFRRDQYSGGALVDSSMAVLRRRMREARMAENNYEAPAGWSAWEKRYYPAYVSDVSAAVGALQLLLMGTRPSVAIAAAALLFAGVPVSAVAAVHHLAQLAAESAVLLQHHVVP
ncbi:uncharacterized protein [Oryza sativa Japonica Group]|jgi:hypothetical protein|uniref:Os01g0121600 protein n=6 Tax=Oryza TaxID=4527 RepID=Q0JR37_ORYSJ|nr:uncharacterized protein LOC4326044 [Oryza sativa Japonica Group]KAB8082342.1 hypothetical protein EE612_004213 [Oryza sativa]KAF2948149.1 hypothetical protein DAI22_01g014800 [Oryza sativa Japonica Group]BAF03791.2 Os01g0121600 [Oryza sativa Japonica Group]BAS70137.1 Os01g0121600 [Oryza sativa Japonica Group]|eukprot:NP_001041877.2 Os01g0121600 [Oryza sativa Japonica Group]